MFHFAYAAKNLAHQENIYHFDCVDRTAGTIDVLTPTLMNQTLKKSTTLIITNIRKLESGGIPFHQVFKNAITGVIFF